MPADPGAEALRLRVDRVLVDALPADVKRVIDDWLARGITGKEIMAGVRWEVRMRLVTGKPSPSYFTAAVEAYLESKGAL